MKKSFLPLVATLAIVLLLLGSVFWASNEYLRPIFWEDITVVQKESCGILIIAENFREHEPLHTCVLHDPDNPDNFRLSHPAVPGYEDNSMTFYAGVTTVPVLPRGEGQAY